MRLPIKTSGNAKHDVKSPRWWRVTRRIIGWTFLGVGALVASFLVLMFHQPPPPVVRVDPISAQQIEAQLQRIQTDTTGTVKRILPVDEGALNAVLESYLAANHPGAGDAPTVQDMRVQLVDDRLHVYMVLNARGQDLTLAVETKLHAENGYVVIDPISAKIGELSIPRSTLQTAVQRITDSPQGLQQLRLPLTTSSGATLSRVSVAT